MPLLDRYRDDRTAPRPAAAVQDLAVRVVGPAAALWAFLGVVGWVIKHLLGGLPAEAAANRTLQATRNPVSDDVTGVLSNLANTEYVVAACLVAFALLWWRTRQWWFALVPALASLTETTVFLLVTLVADRPRPAVDHLDKGPPTSSYPSGHTGAATALCWSLALVAFHIRRPALRRVVVTVLFVLPVLVALGRVYRGMHFPSDVAFGLLNGATCALLGWGWVRRRRDRPASEGRDATASTSWNTAGRRGGESVSRPSDPTVHRMPPASFTGRLVDS